MAPWPVVRDFCALSLFLAAVYALAMLGHAYGL